MKPAERCATDVKHLAKLDQNDRQAAVIARYATCTADRRPAISYSDYFRAAINCTEKLWAKLEAGQ